MTTSDTEDSEERRRFLEFVSKLTVLASQYSEAEFDDFHARARQFFPSAATAVRGLAILARGEPQRRGTVAAAKRARDERTKAAAQKKRAKTAARRRSRLRELLMSREVLPSNLDLVRLATESMEGMPKLRYDKMSRERIVNHILAHVDELNSGRRGRLERVLMDAAMEPNSKRSDFFSAWEKVIKGIDL